jgi:choline dehydrogenase-like flavoprotein
MAADDADAVTLDRGVDEHGLRRARVDLRPTACDERTWDLLDASADELVRALTAGAAVELLTPDGFAAATPVPAAARRESIGCGHHETGSLRIGADPRSSACDGDARLWGFANLYAAGPPALCSVGSAGPVWPALAQTLRLAEHLRGGDRASGR